MQFCEVFPVSIHLGAAAARRDGWCVIYVYALPSAINIYSLV